MSTTINWRRSQIKVLHLDDGTMVHSHAAKATLLHSYHWLLGQPDQCTPTVGSIKPHGLYFANSNASFFELTTLFTCQELCHILLFMRADSAPGPDGFTLLFYQRH